MFETFNARVMKKVTLRMVGIDNYGREFFIDQLSNMYSRPSATGECRPINSTFREWYLSTMMAEKLSLITFVSIGITLQKQCNKALWAAMVPQTSPSFRAVK